MQIPGVEFLDSLNNDNFENDEIRFELPRGHSWTVGTFELSEPLETAILGSFFERGGGDSFEIAVIEGDAIADVEVDGAVQIHGWQLLGDGVLGWSIKTSRDPAVKRDLTDAVVTDRPVEFDVDGDTGMADQLTIPNPDPNVYTTTLDIDGITFQIASTGTLSPGEAFDIIDVDQIVGTPIITSLVPGQTWSFNSATGQIVSCETLAGDYNSDGVVDTADIDLQAVAMQSPTTNLATFDENGDGTINEDDRVIWVTRHARPGLVMRTSMGRSRPMTWSRSLRPASTRRATWRFGRKATGRATWCSTAATSWPPFPTEALSSARAKPWPPCRSPRASCCCC